MYQKPVQFWSDQFLLKLLELRKENPELTFWLRQRNAPKSKEKRLENGYWFQGDDSYIAIGLYKIPTGDQSTQSVSFKVKVSDFESLEWAVLEIIFKGQHDPKVRTFYDRCLDEIAGFTKESDIHYKLFFGDGSNVLENLSHAFGSIKSQMDQIKNELGIAEKLDIDPDKFSRWLDKTLSIKEGLQINGYPSEVEDKTNTSSAHDEELPLNQILFGPPGAGKTYRLNEIKKDFIDESVELAEEDVAFELAKNNAWWKIIAAILYSKGPMTVPELVSHPVIQAKYNPDKPTRPSQIIWSLLQLHTKEDNPNVKLSRRQGILLFDKDEASNWSVDKSIVDIGLIDIRELSDQIAHLGDQTDTPQKKERFKFVTFHQSFTYEDFVEGIKPVLTSEEGESDSDELGYTIEKGKFYQACQEALRLAGYKSFNECYEDPLENRKAKFEKAKPYAIFIDEINRGNVSAIFGELITLIEPDKRIGGDEEIWLDMPYDKTIKFSIPPNLYIIGTMNTADRSVEALDTALRRRFSFREVAPQPDLLQPYYLLWRLWLKDWDYNWEHEVWVRHEASLLKLIGEKTDQTAYEKLEEELDKGLGLRKNLFEGIVDFNKINPALLLSTINDRIELLLDKDHMIGHSHFFSLIASDNCEKELYAIFYDKIIPLLEEYFYGDYGKIGLVLGDQFVKIKPGKKIEFASFQLDDQSLLRDKPIYKIENFKKADEIDFDAFLTAFKSIYASPKPIDSEGEASYE